MTDDPDTNNSRQFQVSPSARLKRDFIEASRSEAFLPTTLEEMQAEYKARHLRWARVAALARLDALASTPPRPPRPPPPPPPEPLPPSPPAVPLQSPIFRPRPRRPPRVEAIQWAVCEHYGLAMLELLSARKPNALALSRQVGMYLAKVLTSLSLPQIAARFNRDHTTVIHAVRVIEARLGHDEELEASVAMLKDRLEP